MLLSPVIQLVMNASPQLHSRKCQVMLYKNIWQCFWLNYLSGSNWINHLKWIFAFTDSLLTVRLMLMLVFALIISIIIIPIMILIIWEKEKTVRIAFAVGQSEGQSKDFTMSIGLCYINGNEVSFILCVWRRQTRRMWMHFLNSTIPYLVQKCDTANYSSE